MSSNMERDDHGSRATGKVDRTTTTPMYVRMYCRLNGHHRIDEFDGGKCPTGDEVIIYTWKDATLKELSGLIKEVFEDSKRKDARFSFKSYFQTNYNGRWQTKSLGTVYNSRPTRDDEVSLMETKFQPGDIIDVAIFLPAAGIAPPQMEA